MGTLVRERERISELSKTFNVSLSWAVERRLSYLDSELRKMGDEVSHLLSLKGKRLNEVEIALVDRVMDGLMKQYRRIEGRINGLKYGEPKEGITDSMIEAARSYPMGELVGMQRKGNVRCPFHEDRHPSASIKNNRLHCFACNKTWGPIDFIMEKDGIGFKEAVTRLA